MTGIANAVKCYRCTVGPSLNKAMANQSQQLCSKFDESNDYVIDCPYSTMCMKKVYRLKLMNGEMSEAVSRNCADQKYAEQVSDIQLIDSIRFDRRNKC